MNTEAHEFYFTEALRNLSKTRPADVSAIGVPILIDHIEELERVIQGMYPLWVAAMSYGEHGRAADLNMIRSYYNNCPMSTEDIELMFSIKEMEK